MTKRSLQCTFDDARRNHLRAGIAMSTTDKIAFFDEMLALAARFGARDRHADHLGASHCGAQESSKRPASK